MCTGDRIDISFGTKIVTEAIVDWHPEYQNLKASDPVPFQGMQPHTQTGPAFANQQTVLSACLPIEILFPS